MNNSLRPCAIVVPTLNAAAYLRRHRLPIDRRTDVLIVDSSSNDETVPLALQFGFQVHTIARTAFDHGGTRQFGVNWAAQRGYALVLFLTQDALQLADGAIDILLAAFNDATVAAAYGRQLPRPQAGLLERHARCFNYPVTDRHYAGDDLARLGVRAAFMSNSFAAYRIDALQAVGGFATHCIFGEDMQAALQLLRHGWRTAYVAAAQTVHSHGYSSVEEFRRAFDTGVLHRRVYAAFPELRAAENEGWRFVRSQIRWLAHRGPWQIPLALWRTALKYSAYRLGKQYPRWSMAFTVWCSMNKGHWLEESKADTATIEHATAATTDVLMAVYNGAAWLNAQLDSLMYQTHSAFSIIVVDDGSTDGSSEIVRRHALFLDGRIRLVENAVNRGVLATATVLLGLSTAQFALWADQDDWWLADKVERFVHAAQSFAAAHGAATPLLLHSDLRVVDSRLNVVHESLWRYQHLDPRRGIRFERLLMQNVVTGCASLVNRALIERIGAAIAPQAVMHDYYLALAAAAWGQVVYLPVSTVLYRQHGGNTLGAQPYRGRSWQRWRWAGLQAKIRHSVLDRSAQAAVFLQIDHAPLSTAQRTACQAMAALPQSGWWMRRYLIMRHGLWKTGFLRNVILLLVV